MVETELAAEAARTRRPEDLLPLRQALEGILAVEDDRVKYIEADERFHLTMARIAGNRVLLAFLEVLLRLIRPEKATVLLSPQNRQLSDREHQELFQAIVAGDAEQARVKMREHLRQGRELLLDYACSIPATSSSTSTADRRSGNNLSRATTRKKNGGKRS
jgi:GntR family transcriptional regulator, uxu operon transcriptional repressor